MIGSRESPSDPLPVELLEPDATEFADSCSYVYVASRNGGAAGVAEVVTLAPWSLGVVDGVLDISSSAHYGYTFTVEPASIIVPEGTAFTVNGISHPASEAEFENSKIDPFNHVPSVIGMEPGTSDHDDIREWCGTLFTDTSDFRLTSCSDPLYIPVDRGG